MTKTESVFSRKLFFDALYHYCFVDARLWHRALSYSYDNIELFCKAYLLLLLLLILFRILSPNV